MSIRFITIVGPTIIFVLLALYAIFIKKGADFISDIHERRVTDALIRLSNEQPYFYQGDVKLVRNRLTIYLMELGLYQYSDRFVIDECMYIIRSSDKHN